MGTAVFIIKLIFILYCLVSALSDARKRSISLGFSIAVLLMGCALLFLKEKTLHDLLAGILPGVVMIIISRLSGGALGTGDGVFMTGVGLYMGLKSALLITIYAFMAAGALGLVLITAAGVSGRAGNIKKRGIPFVTVAGALALLIKGGFINV